MIGKRTYRRAGVVYIDGDHYCECDCCDQKKRCVHIALGITNFVWIICKDCLNEFLFHFYTEKDIRKMKLIDIQNSKPKSAQ